MTAGYALGLPPAAIGNPHAVPAEQDMILAVRRDVPGYSETAFLTSWNPHQNIGLFLHMGRCQQDLDMWWAQILVYLPDGRIAAQREYGRGPSDNSHVRAGGFALEMHGRRGHWSCRYDGAAEITTPATMAEHPVGSGIARPVRFELHTEPRGPIWDMYTALGKPPGAQGWAQGTHIQQVLHLRGQITVDGTEYNLDGTAANDHSSGPRSISDFGHHHFLTGAYPGGTLQCMSVFSMTGQPLMQTGSHVTDGAHHTKAHLIDVPIIDRTSDTSGAFTATLVQADGSTVPIDIEILHTAPVSATEAGDNINGIPCDGPDLLAITEYRVRFTLPEGVVGYAHLERSTQRSRLLQARATDR